MARFCQHCHAPTLIDKELYNFDLIATLSLLLLSGLLPLHIIIFRIITRQYLPCTRLALHLSLVYTTAGICKQICQIPLYNSRRKTLLSLAAVWWQHCLLSPNVDILSFKNRSQEKRTDIVKN